MTTAAVVFVLANLGDTLAGKAKPKSGFAQVDDIKINGHWTRSGTDGQTV